MKLTPNKRTPIKSITLALYKIIENEQKESVEEVKKKWKHFLMEDLGEEIVIAYGKSTQRSILVSMARFHNMLHESSLENEIRKISNNFEQDLINLGININRHIYDSK